jgi:hypothetical protein
VFVSVLRAVPVHAEHCNRSIFVLNHASCSENRFTLFGMRFRTPVFRIIILVCTIAITGTGFHTLLPIQTSGQEIMSGSL